MSEQGICTTAQPAAIAAETLEAILVRHRLNERPVVTLAGAGADNHIFLLGEDLVLRIPRERADGEYDLQTVQIAVAEARAADVRTPRIVAADDTRELVPVPYVILEMLHGEPLSQHTVAPSGIPQVWRELGRDLALLHNGVRRDGPAGGLDSPDVQTDPRPWLEVLAGEGLLAQDEAAWLLRWIDALEPVACTGSPTAFCHGDLNAGNVIVRPGVFEYLGVVDWDAAGWTDPVWDFVPLPLQATPFILRGYREVAEVQGDSSAEARLLWHHIQYIFRWWTLRQQGRDMVVRGLERLRVGVKGLLSCREPGGWPT